MSENNSPFLNKDFVSQDVPIDSIPEMVGVSSAGDTTGVTEGDNNALTLGGYGAADFSLITHSHQMSHPYSIIGEVDDRDSFIFYFNTEGTAPIVRMAIRGIGYPARHFVDLPAHDHGSVPTGTHTHGLAGTFSGTTGGETPVHTHEYYYPTGGGEWGHQTGNESIGHTHDIAGSTAGTSGTPSATGATSAGVSGGTLAATKKQYAHDLTIWFDGVDVTSKWLTATGWASIGDGTGTHAIHTVGTSLVDVSAFITWASGIHSIEIKEPVTDQGCRISLFIDTLYSVDPHAILLGTDADTLDGKHGSEYVTTAYAIASLEPKVTAGTATQYYRGDKAWKHLPIYGLCPEDYGAVGDYTADDTSAVQSCVTACLADQDRPIPMICTGKYRLTGHVHINRSHHANTGGGDDVTYGLFRIIGMGKGAGFYVNSAIDMFSTTLRWINPPYADPDAWPVSGGVSFEGIQFEVDDSTRLAYVIDGLHLGLHLWFKDCHFTKMKMLNSTNYLQTIYIYDCVMRYWYGTWWTSVDAIDINFRGNLAEFGGDLFNISSGTYSGMAGMRFIDNDVENSGAVLLGGGSTGVRFEGNYLEENSPTTWVTFGNSNGVVHTGNRYVDSRALGTYHTFGTTTKVLDNYNFQV